MISSRRISEKDRESVERALAQDAFHKGTEVDVFYDPKANTNIYEDEHGPVFLLRGTKSLRIDMAFFSNADIARNKAAMLAGFQQLVDRAKAAGFSEITTSSNSSSLVRFAENLCGFTRVQTTENNEIALRRLL